MDQTTKIWCAEKGEQLLDLTGHQGEIVSINFSSDGDKVITGSFDGTAKVWDIRTGENVLSLEEH